jgi:hypothetical protein
MRLPRLRFTVRRLIVAVAILGLLMGTGRWVVRMRIRSAAYRGRAYAFAGKTAQAFGRSVKANDGGRVNVYDNENSYLQYAWAREMANKYWRLTNRPWLPAGPDPPRPERLAHPRPAVDCPAELRSRGPSIRWYFEPVSPWWTFLWTWRNQEGRLSIVDPRWTFP